MPAYVKRDQERAWQEAAEFVKETCLDLAKACGRKDADQARKPYSELRTAYAACHAE